MQEIILTIERESGEGEGIAFYEGKTVFVLGTLAGERVKARIIRQAKRYAHAQLLQVLQPSPLRVVPPCPYHGVCGGCTLQNMSYAASLAAKQKRVLDCLTRLGKQQPDQYILHDIIGMQDPWRYRNKAIANIDQGKIGFYQTGTHIVVDIEDCCLQNQSFAKALNVTRTWLNQGGVAHAMLFRTTSKGEIMVALHTHTKELAKASSWVEGLRAAIPSLASALHGVETIGDVYGNIAYHTLWGEESMQDQLCDIDFPLSPLSFAQVNPKQAERLYHRAVAMAGLTGQEQVIDAYCGAGVLTQMLAEKAKRVVGIEVIPSAIDDANRAVTSNHCDNVEFVLGTCEEILPGMQADVLVLDPPRKGCDQQVLLAAANSKVARIVYISCDPATLSRDIERLCGMGYRLAEVSIVDMFPWTGHVESVALLVQA